MVQIQEQETRRLCPARGVERKWQKM